MSRSRSPWLQTSLASPEVVASKLPDLLLEQRGGDLGSGRVEGVEHHLQERAGSGTKAAVGTSALRLA